MIEGYLLGTDYVSPLRVLKFNGRYKPTDLERTGRVQDWDGRNQLEGEMRRYWRQETVIYDPRRWGFPISTYIVHHYCTKHDLPDSKVKFTEKLGIRP